MAYQNRDAGDLLAARTKGGIIRRTYFIGYARSPRTIEQMLENMFLGRPPGNYDRLLDFSVAKTGNLFFVPSATFLENAGSDTSNIGSV